MAQASKVPVKIDTVEGPLSCTISSLDKGKELFDKVVSALDLTEFWYFGLQYEARSGEKFWIHLGKNILDHDLKTRNPVALLFRIRFYPPDPASDVIQSTALRHFYLEAKQSVLDGTLYCPAEEALVLSSFAVQARYGNYDKKVHRKGYLYQHKVTWLPRRIQSKYGLSNGEWEKVITVLFELRRDLTPEDSMRDYLRLAQDLYEYGAICWRVSVTSGVNWVMAISPFGLIFYPPLERFLPATAFHWGEITDMSTSLHKDIIVGFKDQKEASCIITQSMAVTKHVIRLCKGTLQLLRIIKSEPEVMRKMRAQEKKERQKSSAEPHMRDDLANPSFYLHGRPRARQAEKKKYESQREGAIKKQIKTRQKHIQKQVDRYQTDMDKVTKDIRNAEAEIARQRERAERSLEEWKDMCEELLVDPGPVRMLVTDRWLEHGYKPSENAWKDDAASRKSRVLCDKKYATADKDRNKHRLALENLETVKKRRNSLMSPLNLHIDDGGLLLDEQDPQIVSGLEIMKEPLSPYPWEDRESAEDGDLHIQQDLQSTQSLMIKLAQEIREDAEDESFRDQTEGLSKYRLLRMFIEVPIQDRIFVLENGEYVDPDSDPDSPREKKEGKRVDLGLLGRRLGSRQGLFAAPSENPARPASRMFVPKTLPAGADSYELADYLDDL